MVVVDTSVFIDLLRGKKIESLEALIVAGLTLLSCTVHLELLQGVRKADELHLRRFLASLSPVLPWPRAETCRRVLQISRGSGIKVGLPDVLVLADALDHGAKIMTRDRQLSRLAKRAKVSIMEIDE